MHESRQPPRRGDSSIREAAKAVSDDALATAESKVHVDVRAEPRSERFTERLCGSQWLLVSNLRGELPEPSNCATASAPVPLPKIGPESEEVDGGADRWSSSASRFPCIMECAIKVVDCCGFEFAAHFGRKLAVDLFQVRVRPKVACRELRCCPSPTACLPACIASASASVSRLPFHFPHCFFFTPCAYCTYSFLAWHSLHAAHHPPEIIAVSSCPHPHT